MRGTGENTTFVCNENMQIIGVNLGADFVAEHEWGVGRLQDLFGVDQNKLGLNGRKATNGLSEPTVMLLETETHAVVVVDEDNSYLDQDLLKIPTSLNAQISRWDLDPKIHDPSCSWDSKSFAIASCDKDFIERLYQAIKEGDIAIFLDNEKPFKKSGLCINIASMMDDETQRVLMEHDLDKKRLREEANATGIHAKLALANKNMIFGGSKSYYQLRPYWTEPFKKKTDYKVLFFLNPVNQTKYNHGYFTVEELEDWINDTGPVMKTEVEYKY